MNTIFDFLEAYRSTWESVMSGHGHVDSLSRFFHVPCVMIGPDGAMTETRSEADVLAFNITRRDAFKAGNAMIAKFRGVDVQSQGQHIVLATVNWELFRPDQTTERAWRHYYTIRIVGDQPKILVSTFQIGS